MFSLALVLINSVSFSQIRRAKTVYPAADSSINTQPVAGNEKNSRKEMLKELNLTKEQQKQVRDIMQGLKTKRDAIQNDSTLSKADRRKKLMELRKEQADKILPILNEEQKEKWKAMRQENMNKPEEQ